MKYRVVTYIRVNPVDEVLYDTMEEAEVNVGNLQLTQPRDIHVLEAVPGPSAEHRAHDIGQRAEAARRLRGLWEGGPGSVHYDHGRGEEIPGDTG